jgi:hypothetical protein
VAGVGKGAFEKFLEAVDITMNKRVMDCLCRRVAGVTCADFEGV